MIVNRRLALATLAVGLLVITAAVAVSPADAPPLYDGVVPLEPYQWVDPPPGQQGGAQGASATITVTKGKNELVAVATPELMPQAQVFGVPGSLTLPSGATSIMASIAPMAPSIAPSTGYIDGNVYRILLTDQAGAPVTADASQRVSVVLRSVDPSLEEATIARFDGTTWQPLKTSPPDAPGGGFLAVVTEFGDFAVVASGVSPYPTTPASDAVSDSPSVTSSPPAATRSPAVATPATTPGGTAAPPAGPPPPDLPWLSIGVTAGFAVVLVAAWAAVRRRRRRRPYRGARPGTRR